MSKRCLLVGVCSLLVVSAIESAARADVTQGYGEARGVEANITEQSIVGFGGLLFGFPGTPNVFNSSPPPFSNNVMLGGVSQSSVFPSGATSLTTGLLDVTATSNVDGTAGAKTSSATSILDNSSLSLVASGVTPGPALFSLGATSITSQSQVSGDFGTLLASGSTTILGGTISVLGIDLTALVFPTTTPAPNTLITVNDATLGGLGLIGGSVDILLNGQFGGSIPASGFQNTLGIDLTFKNLVLLNDPTAPVTNGTLTFGNTFAFQAADPPVGGDAQPVPEPSSLALCAVLGVAGIMNRIKRRTQLPRTAAV